MYKNKNRLIVSYLLPTMLLILVIVYVPIILNVFYALFRWSSFSQDKVYVGMGNFARLFKDKAIKTAFINNVRYAVISVVFQVGVSMVIAAVLEDKVMRKAQPIFRTIYFLPSMISLTVVGLLWQIIFSPIFGLVNPIMEQLGMSTAGLDLLGNTKTAIFAVIGVSQWQYMGYTLVLFLVAMQKIPEDLYEAAHIDGAGPFTKFFAITIPQIKEIILVNLVVTIIGSFKVFEEVYTMTGGGPGKSSEVLGTYLYRVGFRNDEMGYAAAIATLIFAITFILSLIQLNMSKIGKEDT